MPIGVGKHYAVGQCNTFWDPSQDYYFFQELREVQFRLDIIHEKYPVSDV